MGKKLIFLEIQTVEITWLTDDAGRGLEGRVREGV